MGPMIRIEIDHVKESILHHMGERHDEFNRMVRDSLNNCLNETWVAERVQRSVDECVRKAIDGMADNYKLRSAVEDAIASAITEMVKSKE